MVFHIYITNYGLSRPELLGLCTAKVAGTAVLARRKNQHDQQGGKHEASITHFGARRKRGPSQFALQAFQGNQKNGRKLRNHPP